MLSVNVEDFDDDYDEKENDDDGVDCDKLMNKFHSHLLMRLSRYSCQIKNHELETISLSWPQALSMSWCYDNQLIITTFHMMIMKYVPDIISLSYHTKYILTQFKPFKHLIIRILSAILHPVVPCFKFWVFHDKISRNGDVRISRISSSSEWWWHVRMISYHQDIHDNIN